jgi:ATPase family associated with various cellular activities (AAA)
MTSNSSFTFNIEPYDLYGSFYESVVGLELARRGLHHTFYGCFGYVPNLPATIDQRELIASELDSKGRVLREVRAWDKGLVEIKFSRTPETRRYIETWGYFDSREEAALCLSFLGKHLPPETTQLHDGTVSVSFWNAAMERGDYRPRRESQTMCVPKWQEIATNYPARVRPELASTMRLRESRIPASRLMLWRGLPGTGKTWAIRAMMREWLDWCTFHYVVDPAAFFSNSNYMLSLLSKVSEVGQSEDGDRKWSLIILEDAGEFIAMDSRHQYGQALAKLLNLCDGLLGQGQKLLFLITTNEEVQNLHPAIVRHGRCLTNLEFCEFSELEAREWLEARGHTLPASKQRLTLSDLFAVAGSQPAIVNVVPLKRAGFIR